ncbi:DNA-binding protein Alba [Candidatus Methanoperedens nitratireducens]|uniref:DNA/RNA-binding protein Alba n=1 Tax=Candidatus Methanoperedens nitratireducens TaxID=1392998 RepID=A0A284VQD2_9EURY|nr:DNA-binding protein Alba [Candidatus Methanoperedens nitroreducens]SNQ61485.1 DNA/RNA-binding protein Alba [Candidatus Methanoperedens nitroreducens]
MADNNVVYIGNKPVMNYVLAVVKEFNNGAKEVTVKARGRAISRAVDAVEVSKNRFVTDTIINNIKIGTEKMVSENGESNVSIIEIVMAKSPT